MSSHHFHVPSLAVAPAQKSTASHTSSIGVSTLPQTLSRKLTIPNHLTTDLLDIELQPLPSPYSPLASTTSSSMWMQDTSSLNAFLSQPAHQAQQQKTISTTRTSGHADQVNESTHFMSLNFDTYSPPPTSYHQQRFHSLQSWQDDHEAMYTDSELEPMTITNQTEGPTRKKAKFVSESLTRWDSRRSVCSDTSMESDTSSYSHEECVSA